jgi:hypothetical protein
VANIIEIIVRANAGAAIAALGKVEEGSKRLAVAGAAITGPLALAVKGFQAYGEEIDRANRITGISVERLQMLRFAIEQEHGTLNDLIAATERWAVALTEAADPTSNAARLIEKMGLSVRELRDMKIDESLILFGQALNRVESDTTRSAIAIKMLGGGYKGLMPFLRQSTSDIERNMEMARKLGLVFSDEAVKGAEEFGDRLTELTAGLRGAAMTLGAQLMPFVRELVVEATRAMIAVTGWMKEHPVLTMQILKTAAVLGGLLTAIGGVGVAAAFLIKGLVALRIAVIALANPVIGLTAAFAALLGLGLTRLEAEANRMKQHAEDSRRISDAYIRGIIKDKDLVLRAVRGEASARAEAIKIIEAHGAAQAQQAAMAKFSAEMEEELARVLRGGAGVGAEGISVLERRLDAINTLRDRQMAYAAIMDDTIDRMKAEIAAIETHRTSLAKLLPLAKDENERRTILNQLLQIENDLLIRNNDLKREQTRLTKQLVEETTNQLVADLTKITKMAEEGDVFGLERLRDQLRGAVPDIDFVIDKFKALAVENIGKKMADQFVEVAQAMKRAAEEGDIDAIEALHERYKGMLPDLHILTQQMKEYAEALQAKAMLEREAAIRQREHNEQMEAAQRAIQLYLDMLKRVQIQEEEDLLRAAFEAPGTPKEREAAIKGAWDIVQARREARDQELEHLRTHLQRELELYEGTPEDKLRLRIIGLEKQLLVNGLTEEQQGTIKHEIARTRRELNNLIMEPIDRVVGGIQSAIEQMIVDVATGSKTALGGIVDFARSVGRAIISEVAKAVAQSVVESLRLREVFSSLLSGLKGGGFRGLAGGGLLGFLFGLLGFGFAQGGISPGRLTPVRAAEGWISNRPTLATLSEFNHPEAVIPLKKGKIPVELAGAAGMNVVNIFAWDTETGLQKLYEQGDHLANLMGMQRRMNHPAFRGG